MWPSRSIIMQRIFLSAVVIIASFHPATGLKCFQQEDHKLCDDTSVGGVRTCDGANPGCSISESYVYMGIAGAVRICQRSCLDDLNSSNEGCHYNNIDGGYVNICNCGSDGCNRDFHTAGGF